MVKYLLSALFSVYTAALCFAQAWGVHQRDSARAQVMVKPTSPYSQVLTFDSIRVAIAPWHQGKQAAVSLTFDDNLPQQFSRALPAMNSRGIKGSFYVITGQAPWAQARAAATSGHEVGSHSASHVDLRNSNNLQAELAGSQDSIRRQVGASQGYTIAWPFGGTNATVLAQAKQHYLGGRSAGINANGYEKPSYNRPDRVGALLMSNSQTLAYWGQLLRNAIADSGWVVPMYHGIDSGYSQVPLAKFESQLDSLMAQEDKLWIAPFGQVLQYQRQRNEGLLHTHLWHWPTIQVQSDMIIFFTDTLPDSLVNQPLTLEVEFFPYIPQHPFGTTIDLSSSDGSFFDTIVSYTTQMPEPVHRTVVSRQLLKNGLRLKVGHFASVAERPRAQPLLVAPNPATSGQALQLRWGQQAPATLVLADALGRVLLRQPVQGGQATLQVPQLPAGCYSLQVQGSTTRYAAQLLLQ